MMLFHATRRQVGKLAAVFALLLVAGACNNDDDADPKTIADLILERNDFTILRAAVQRANLSDNLKAGTLTLFAPNDAAFQASGFPDAASVNAVDATTLGNILRYHVLNSRVALADIPEGSNNLLQEVPTLLTNNNVFVYKAGGALTVNGNRVSQTDIQAANGIIHVIDRVLLPPPAAPNGSIVGVIAGRQNLSLANAALQRVAASNPTLAASLQSNAQAVTVFAPTDDAFRAAGYANQAAITVAPVNELIALLTNHVVLGRFFSNNLNPGSLTTAGGGQITVAASNGNPTLRTAKMTTAATILTPNLIGSNGVVHIVDRILVP